MGRTITILLHFCWLLILTPVISQTSNWEHTEFERNAFVENIGQFDAKANETTGKVLYAADLPFLFVLFGEKGISYQYRELKKIVKEEHENAPLNVDLLQLPFHQKERLYGKYLLRTDEISASWGEVSNSLKLNGEGLLNHYHSYSVPGPDGKLTNFNYVKKYSSIVYKNIYQGIDIRFELHPVSGLKYSIILHPGADPEKISMLYDLDLELNQGDIHISTLFGDMVDHKPVTFYSDDTKSTIPSNFVLNGNKVSFELGKYDNSRTVVIDPWTQSPNFNTNWDCIWEVDHDAAGNVYIIGGVDNMDLMKYNAGGTLQWTHTTPYDTSAWLGTLGTDLNGNSYVTNGTEHKIQKVSTSGALVWDNPAPAGPGIAPIDMPEFWNITFSGDQSEMYIGGTLQQGLGFNLYGAYYRMDTTNGNILEWIYTSGIANISTWPPAVQEVRAACMGPDGTVYILSMDTLAALDGLTGLCGQNVNLAPVNHGLDWGYKWEDWRLNNTGVKALRAYGNSIYIHAGSSIQRRSLTNFSLISSAPIPNGVFAPYILNDNRSSNAGIDIDSCGNIYVGSTDGVYRFDPSLNITNFYPTGFKVWDVQVSGTGVIVACGGTGVSTDASRAGGVASINTGGCSYQLYTGPGQGCCDASFLAPASTCVTEASFDLIETNPGGTWSGNGMDSTGTFDPALAGAGIHTVYYSLPCGTDSMVIVVDPCVQLEICADANGYLFVTQGTPPFLWFNGIPSAGTVSVYNENSCMQCSGNPQYGNFNTYSSCDDGMGNNITDCPGTVYAWDAFPFEFGIFSAPPLSYPILVVDGSGDSLIYNSLSEIPACLTSVQTVTMSDEVYVYPVPATDQLFLIASQDVTGYKVYDLFGRLISQGNGSVIDVSLYAAGSYSVEVQFGERSILKRFVKK